MNIDNMFSDFPALLASAGRAKPMYAAWEETTFSHNSRDSNEQKLTETHESFWSEQSNLFAMVCYVAQANGATRRMLKQRCLALLAIQLEPR